MKILIVYAQAGAGHRRAAEAVLAAFRRKGSAQDVRLIDCLDYTPLWFKRFYPQVYILLVRFLPLVWAGIYYLLDNRVIYFLIKPLRGLNNCLVSKKFTEFLIKEHPQVVVSTQFFASEVVAALKKKKRINSILISVVTDFGAHKFWESAEVDLFGVASIDTKNDLLARKIPEEKIKVLGIPIEPPPRGFNQAELRKEIGLKEGLFTVLIVGGGFGVGPIKALVNSLAGLSGAIREKIQLLVVCSRNKKLHAEMQNLAPGLKIAARIFGFVPNLYRMMAASDVIISKSGGLTTSEALAAGLPMVIISPIPGQEAKNCRLLLKKGVGLRINRAGAVKRLITQLIENPDSLNQMRCRALSLARPNAADDIADLARRYIDRVEK